MQQFFINRPSGFESMVQTIVKQSFPFATPSELALKATEPEMRDAPDFDSTQISGSNRERFVWGISRLGSSRIVG